MRLVLSVLLIVFASTPAWTQKHREPIECDILGASFTDDDRVAEGVGLQDLTPEAEPACTAAVLKFPTSSQLRFQLARGLFKVAKQDEALIVARKLAEEGYRPAQLLLSYALREGLGTAKDIAEADRLEELAADSGSLGAMALVAYRLLYGDPSRQDPVRAIKLLQKSAVRNAIAQHLLAQEYFTGRNLAKDIDRSYQLASMSASQGYSGGAYLAGFIRGVPGTVHYDLLAAEGLLRVAIKKKHAGAAYLLASWNESGIVKGATIEETLRLYELALAFGDVKARVKVDSLRQILSRFTSASPASFDELLQIARECRNLAQLSNQPETRGVFEQKSKKSLLLESFFTTLSSTSPLFNGKCSVPAGLPFHGCEITPSMYVRLPQDGPRIFEGDQLKIAILGPVKLRDNRYMLFTGSGTFCSIELEPSIVRYSIFQ